MISPASLKSHGRITCHGSQMFYELILVEKQYIVKYYNEQGKLKLARPIKFPTQSIEIHTAGNYLLCYMHSDKSEISSVIFLLQLSNCLMNAQSCDLHLPCKKSNSNAIARIYFNESKQIIIFSDQERNIYLLRVVNETLKCERIHYSDRKIDRIQLNQQQNIVLITEERQMKVLTMDWSEFGKVIRDELFSHHADYYFQNGFQVNFYDDNVEQGFSRQKLIKNQRDQERQYLLLIEDKQQEIKFKLNFAKKSNFIFYSTCKNALMVFNKQENSTVALINGIFKTYTEAKGINILKNLTQDNFLMTYKTDKTSKSMIQLRVYDGMIGVFQTYQFIPQTSKKSSSLVQLQFLKKNIENILNFNGLIQPIYEDTVRKGLEEIQGEKSDMSRSKSNDYRWANLNSIDLAYHLLKNGLEIFPKQIEKIAKKLRAHILYVKQTSYITEVKRIFEYCEMIQNEVVNSLKLAYEGVQDRNEKRQRINYSNDSQVRSNLGKSKQIIQNLINFLHLIINELKYELHEIQFEDSQRQKKQHQKFNQGHVMTDMKYYHEVKNSAISLFMVIRLLLDEDTIIKFKKQLDKLIVKKEISLNIWKQKYSHLYLMEYPPLFLHENFKTISYLSLQTKSTFEQFIIYLLQNRANYLEVAYFYQYVSKIPALPFMGSDIGDLIQNIWIHIQPLVQLEEGRDPNKSKDEEEEVRFVNLIHKMAGTALRIKQYSFTKYIIQLAITYQVYSIAVMLIHSNTFEIGQEDINDERQHIFMVKSLLLAGRLDLAYLYVLNHHSSELFEEFVKWSKVCEKQSELVQFSLQQNFRSDDEKSLDRLLNHPTEKRQFLNGLMNKLNSP